MWQDEPVDETRVWEPSVAAVPPVIGRVDPETRRPMLRYDTTGEISDENDESDDWFEADGGVGVSIAF